MKVLIEEEKKYLTDEQKVLIERVARKALETEGFSSDFEISVFITDNVRIRKLNLKYRKIDKATDVLSFPQFTKEELKEGNFSNAACLGDIIISFERAEEQAKEYGHSLNRELAFLTAHSMLHLLGYDHQESLEEEEMIEKQKEILNALGILR